MWLINTHNGYTDDKGNQIPRINIDNYPAVKEYLDKYWDKIEKRYDKGDTPYNLRNCAYMGDFFKPKICWASVGKTEYCFIPKGFFLLDTNYFFSITNESSYLIVILNSKLITYWINNEDTPIGKGGAYRHYKYNLEKLPIRKTNNTLFLDLAEQILTKKSKKEDTISLEKEIDTLVYQLYELTEEEIGFIENC